MAVLVGSARIDENGNISGGKAGDQSGNEVSTQEWYSKPWDFIAIHPDANVREKHAQAVEQACENDNIGYDQNERNTLNTQAAKVDYVIKNIQTKCECDCSSLQNVAAIASGADKAPNYGSNGWTTSTMRSKLKALGYIIITTSTYLKSAAYCVRGAIYVSEGHHTVAGLSNGSSYEKTLEKAGVSTSSTTSTTSSTDSLDKVAQDVIAGKYGNGEDRKKALEKAGYNYDEVQARVNEILGVTKSSSSSGSSSSSSSSSKTVVATDSAASFSKSIAGTYKVTANSGLNVRNGAGISKKKLVAIPKGTKVQNYGYYTKTNGVKWYYVQFTYNGTTYIGFCNSTYLSK